MEIKNLGLTIPDENCHLEHNKMVEESIIKKESKLGPRGTLLVSTGKYTGRCPKDRFIVDNAKSSSKIAWGKINQKISEQNFNALKDKAISYAKQKKMYVTDCLCGADEKYKIKVRFITEIAWHSIFVRNMFIRGNKHQLNKKEIEFTVLNVCGLEEKEYEKYGLNSEVFIIFDLENKLGIIGGTQYSGEMKKGIFSIMNYYLPQKKVLPMHCSANEGSRGDVTLFFGLSGTGKTTLSSDVHRKLIGDDEHGWSNTGVFNFEGGCYAKVINLSPKKEPAIWDTLEYGAILENVVYDPQTHMVDYTDDSITENTRASYPIYLVKNAVSSGVGQHPNNIIFLTADAFGVLPPVAKLTPTQASYHFLSGYTSKVAGTESGIKEPTATFSACFGEPFMVLRPEVYSDLLAQKIREHRCNVFLVNTGWCGGNYNTGKRIDLSTTRQIISDILDGSILSASYQEDSIFGFEVPESMVGIESSLLNPIQAWENKEEFLKTKKKLAEMFVENFKRFGANLSDVALHGPKL